MQQNLHPMISRTQNGSRLTQPKSMNGTNKPAPKNYHTRYTQSSMSKQRATNIQTVHENNGNNPQSVTINCAIPVPPHVASPKPPPVNTARLALSENIHAEKNHVGNHPQQQRATMRKMTQIKNGTCPQPAAPPPARLTELLGPPD